jgi:CO dehydrogenase maturation factor
MDNKTVIIALVGKGGVGKTSLSALTVRLLSKAHPDKKILAIDADPAVGLATALGIEITSTVDDIRKSFVQTVEDGNKNAAIELLGEAKYQMFDALVEQGNISFLAIGRPESAGCYCKVNAYLKEIISMIADNFDYVVIDGEAGIEQVNRRVMEKVTHLILVSDASRKGLQVVQTIYKVAKELVMFDKAGLIINRIPDMSLAGELDTGNLPLLACIPDDREMALNDMRGESVFVLDENSSILQGAEKALEQIGIKE